jgi:hypothetical protein
VFVFSTCTARRRFGLLVPVVLAAASVAVGSVVPAAAAQARPAAHPVLTDRYTAVGTSHIGSIDADLPIAKTSLVETLDAKTFKIRRGTLPVAPQTVSFTALGFVPLRSTVSLAQTSPITGTIRATKRGIVLSTSVSYAIQLSNVEVDVFGAWVSLAVGPNCRTIDPVTISAGSPAGHYFDIAKGGVLTGTYTIGKFQNCAPLHLPDLFGLGSLPVNSLVPGTHNTVRITLSHGHFVSGR